MICKFLLLLIFLNDPELFLLSTIKWFQVLLYNSHNLTCHLFTHIVCSIRPRCNHSGPEQTWEQWQWRSTPHTPKLQDWSLTIRWFNVIIRTLVVGRCTPLQRCSRCILQPIADWARENSRILCIGQSLIYQVSELQQYHPGNKCLKVMK